MGWAQLPMTALFACTNFLLNYVVVVVHGCEPPERGLCVYLGFSCKVHRKLENQSIMLVNKSCCSKLCVCICVLHATAFILMSFQIGSPLSHLVKKTGFVTVLSSLFLA